MEKLVREKTNRGHLDYSVGYLSGAMDYVADHGVAWRREFIKMVHEAGLKIDFIDPTDKPGGEDIKIGEDKTHQNKLRDEGRWVELKEYVSNYRHYDLRFVDHCDFMICAINPNVPQWGTANELYMADNQKKPLFFLIEEGLEKLPGWLFDIIELDDPAKGTRLNVFTRLEDLVQELILLDTGKIPLSKEWVLIRKHIERQRRWCLTV